MQDPEADNSCQIIDLADYRHPETEMPSSFDVDKPGKVFSMQEFVNNGLRKWGQQLLETDIRTYLSRDSDIIDLIRQDYENLMHNSRDLALHHRTLMNALNTYMKCAQGNKNYKAILHKLECAGRALSRLALYIEATGDTCLTHEQQKFLSNIEAFIPTPEEVEHLKCKLRAEALCRLISRKD